MSDFALETFPGFAAIAVFAVINLTLSAVSELNTALMYCVPGILMLLILGIDLGAHFSRRRPFISFLMWFLDQTLQLRARIVGAIRDPQFGPARAHNLLMNL